jgi:hypothetical protein
VSGAVCIRRQTGKKRKSKISPGEKGKKKVKESKAKTKDRKEGQAEGQREGQKEKVKWQREEKWI